MKKPNSTTALFVVLVSLLFTTLGSNTGYSQIDAVFGQNKVQYKTFKWKYLQSKHFDVYFYQGGEYIAEYTAKVAESSLDSISKSFDYRISNRIPIVVFNSHNDFQQNNIIDQYLPEGVGGVTELFKNRVLVPFEGDYEKFRHVIHHELVHAFMNDMYYGGSIQNIISRNITLIFPLWFSEGMAEFQSLDGLDKPTDMFMRDAVVNNYLPPLEYIGGYFAYRAGQSFFAWLADYYGEETIGELMNNIKGLGDVDAAFKETYKISLEKIGEKWQKELKKTYWPGISFREEVDDFSKQLTNHERDGGYYNVSPVISPNGNMFAFISNRDDLFDVFIANANTGEVIQKVINGSTGSDFEELQILTPGLSWSPDGRRLAVSVKAGDRDAIYIINVKSGDEKKLPVKSNNISYVTWSPNGDKLAYVGLTDRESDIYTYDLSTGSVENLTDDIFSEMSPTWSPDGKYIYFTSDRGDYVDKNMVPADFKMYDYEPTQEDIYKVEVQTGHVIRETNIPFSKQSYAQLSPDGDKMLYISDVNGISNLYLRHYDTTGAPIDKPITNSLNPLDQISVSKDGKKMLFVALNKGGYDIYSMNNPFERDIGMDKLVPTEYVMKKYGNVNSEGLVIKINNTNDTMAQAPIVPEMDSTGLTTNDSLMTEDSTEMVKSDTVKGLYGNDIKLSFKDNKDEKVRTNYLDSLYKTNTNFKVADNTNDDGSYKIHNYKIKFTPDIVYGAADYSSYYGVQGTATIAFSDLLGNHRIQILTSMVIDLKNSDYAVGYYYLPMRLDLGAQLFHTARFLLYDRGLGFGDQLYRYRSFGLNLAASYPFSRFKRIDGGITAMHVSKENLDDSSEPIEEKNLFIPSMSFVHDNTLFDYITPVKGTRYNISALGTPKIGENGVGFVSGLMDYRTYFKIADGYSFALRFAGGASFGPNPMRFYIGGVPNWINRDFANNNIPISDIEEYVFSTPGLPLRGYDYDAKSGSRYALMNAELRFPIIRYLILGLLPIGFQNIEGVLFMDAGTAWSDSNPLQLFQDDASGKLVTRDLLTGFGIGTRAVFLNLPLMFDVAWSYNLDKFSAPKYYISIGFDF